MILGKHFPQCSGLGHLTCPAEWNRRTCVTNRDLKSTCPLVLPFSHAALGILRHEWVYKLTCWRVRGHVEENQGTTADSQWCPAHSLPVVRQVRKAVAGHPTSGPPAGLPGSVREVISQPSQIKPSNWPTWLWVNKKGVLLSATKFLDWFVIQQKLTDTVANPFRSNPV